MPFTIFEVSTREQLESWTTKSLEEEEFELRQWIVDAYLANDESHHEVIIDYYNILQEVMLKRQNVVGDCTICGKPVIRDGFDPAYNQDRDLGHTRCFAK